MSFDVYQTWFTRLTEKLQHAFGSNRVVLVLDNAPYHSKRLDRIPTTADRKDAMVAFLEQHEIAVDPTWSKKLLLQAIRRHTAGREEEYQSYVVDKIARDRGVETLWLPPFHCQFSAIELFWGWLKHEVAKEAYPNIKVDQLRDLTLRVSYINIIIRKKKMHKRLTFPILENE